MNEYFSETYKQLAIFYADKTVLITGHSGFKGSWLTFILAGMGARVIGYSLEKKQGHIFDLISGEDLCEQNILADIRDYDSINQLIMLSKPDIVFHLAAQPLVREGYERPRYTIETNTLGTMNVLEALRHQTKRISVVIVTTDKVYRNREWEWAYRESDALGGFDPYAASKSCSELIVDCYKHSFFDGTQCIVSTARAGNVIGGGDFSENRIIPDCVRSVLKGDEIILRNPSYIRPFQHVIEPLCVYLLIGYKQYKDSDISGCYNIGPMDYDCGSVEEITKLFCQYWGDDSRYIVKSDYGPREDSVLKLDNSRVAKALGWKPRWGLNEAVEKTVEWYKLYGDAKDSSVLRECMNIEINSYFNI